MGVTLLLTLCFLKFAKSHHFEHILGSVQEKVEVGIDGNSSNLFALREREMCDLKPGVNMVPTIYMMKCCAADKIFNVNSGSCEDGLFNTSLVQVWRFQSSSSQLDLEQEFSPRPLSDTDLMICSSLLTQEDCGELSRTILDPVLRPQEEFMLLENGTLRMPKLGLYFTSSPQQYCVEQFHTGDQISIHVVVCAREMMDSDEDKDENASCSARFILYPIVESLSSLGLLLTLICYSILPEFRNVPGRCLQCLCFTLLSAMLLLLFTQILGNSIYNKMGLCKVVASLLQFSFLSAFSWMTVLSLDISRAFHLMQVSTTNPSLGRPKSTKKLGLYSLLGFGIPLIITAITAIMDQTLNTNFLRPRFGERGCWFFGNMEILLYFYSPVIILLLANILLFVRTVSSLAIVERKTSFKKGQIRKHSMSQLHQEYSQGREMLSLSVRLFVIMGGLWIFEVVSWIGHTLDHPCWIYIPTDILNLLQGVAVFIIFICKRSTIQKIIKYLQADPRYHERASLARSVSGNCSIAGGAGASGYGTGGGEAVAGTRGEGAGSVSELGAGSGSVSSLGSAQVKVYISEKLTHLIHSSSTGSIYTAENIKPDLKKISSSTSIFTIFMSSVASFSALGSPASEEEEKNSLKNTRFKKIENSGKMFLENDGRKYGNIEKIIINDIQEKKMNDEQQRKQSKKEATDSYSNASFEESLKEGKDQRDQGEMRENNKEKIRETDLNQENVLQDKFPSGGMIFYKESKLLNGLKLNKSFKFELLPENLCQDAYPRRMEQGGLCVSGLMKEYGEKRKLSSIQEIKPAQLNNNEEEEVDEKDEKEKKDELNDLEEKSPVLEVSTDKLNLLNYDETSPVQKPIKKSVPNLRKISKSLDVFRLRENPRKNPIRSRTKSFELYQSRKVEVPRKLSLDAWLCPEQYYATCNRANSIEVEKMAGRNPSNNGRKSSKIQVYKTLPEEPLQGSQSELSFKPVLTDQGKQEPGEIFEPEKSKSEEFEDSNCHKVSFY